ncbi:MAG TPA: Wzz/FepE/Etk N-terminal domain-containing protein, partial [Rhizorhapis sp.]|nr:Wzz/FepE/Etk N-terminal domain-containing protein [Rhizorhapis sp.]
MLAAFWRARCFLSLCIAGGILLACFYLWFVAEPLYTATAIIGPVASQAPASQGGASLASVVGIDIGGARS